MHVGVIHRISDPEGFEAAEQKALETGLPEGFALPINAATPDHTTGICIWQGESVEAVKELVESVVGPYSDNEYFEVENPYRQLGEQGSPPVRYRRACRGERPSTMYYWRMGEGYGGTGLGWLDRGYAGLNVGFTQRGIT